MGPPVRTVCLACLQSLEIASSDEFSGPAHCPYCGTRVDFSRIDPEATTGDAFASPPPDSFSSGSTTPRDVLDDRLIPDRIARFLIREPLGEGGYGQVFRAYDPHLDRDVALKVLKPNRIGEKALERFYREARAAARLDHPNIVGLHDAGCDLGRCWIAYQLVDGRTLSMIRDLERPSVETSVRIVRDLALAIDHAHGRGVFHRDLKPANVLVDASGRARLTDFGLARRGDLDSDLTREGTVLGTPSYMSPEAAAGRAHAADARSDVYSLGVILYELLCGRRPADVPSDAPLWRSTRLRDLPNPRSVDRAISPAMDRICMKALAFDPDDRYPSGKALAEALSRQIPAGWPRSKAAHGVDLRGLAIGLVIAASSLCMVLGMSLQVGNVEEPSSTAELEIGLDPQLVLPAGARPRTPKPAAREAAAEPLAKPADLMAKPAVRSRGSKDPIFHLKDGCRHIKGRDEARLADLGTVREALDAGFRPCRDCLGVLHRPAEAP